MRCSTDRLTGSLQCVLHLFFWFLIALVALAGSIGLVAAIVGWFRGSAILAPDNILVAMVCGLVGWLFVGVFHLRKETVSLRISDRQKFTERMQAILEDMGYNWVHQSDRHWSTRPSFQALLFGPGINMVLEGNRARISGPRLSLDRLRRKYRMASHLDKVRQSISDSKSRTSECYLKRLELSVRMEPEHVNGFHERVLEPLAKHGILLIDTQLMLISEDGMKEGVWTQHIKPWLEENQLHFEFHKDHPQRVTPGITSIAGPINGHKPIDSFIDTCMWS